MDSVVGAFDVPVSVSQRSYVFEGAYILYGGIVVRSVVALYNVIVQNWPVAAPSVSNCDDGLGCDYGSSYCI